MPTTCPSGSDDPAEQVALFRYRVIAEPANPRLTAAERGRIVRVLAAQTHAHPDGTMRAYSRGTLDRCIAAYQAKGLDGLRPQRRADVGAVRRYPELLSEAAALRAEQPARSAAHIADILRARYGIVVSQRTIRSHLRRKGLDRASLGTQPALVFGRYEAERPNQRWIGVRFPRYLRFPVNVRTHQASRTPQWAPRQIVGFKTRLHALTAVLP